MSRRLTTEEKGKGLLHAPPARKRIRAPEIDTSALIQANLLTIIGRLTNPQEQSVNEVISTLPRRWKTEGPVTGADLGHSCFQFRLSTEKDLKEVLANRPYNHNNWMLILQRWEPVISNSFPSEIPFWIKLQGLPLHFWHQEMIYNIGYELGTLDHYEITKTSARMRVLVDGLSPLIMDSIVDYKTGEESLVTFEYEGLKNHCSLCFRLSHLGQDCPFRAPLPEPLEPIVPSFTQVIREEVALGNSTMAAQPVVRSTKTPTTLNNDASLKFDRLQEFSTRLDRHGRPFGDRVSVAVNGAPPLRNKITPRPSREPLGHERSDRHRGNSNAPSYYMKPQYRHRADERRSNKTSREGYSREASEDPHMGRERRNHDQNYDAPQDDLPGQLQALSPSYTTNRVPRRSGLGKQGPSSQQLARTHHAAGNSEEHETPRQVEGDPLPTVRHQEAAFLPRPPLERTLIFPELPPTRAIPTTEEVMEDLIEASHQYVNHPDPTEREARIQRVLETNAQGIMEETAAHIIATATAQSPAQQLICFQPEGGNYSSAGQEISFSHDPEGEPAPVVQDRLVTSRSARPPRTKKSSGVSRGLMGANLRKHNLTMSQRSPATRQTIEDNHSSTPANGSRLRHGRRTNGTPSHNNAIMDQEVQQPGRREARIQSPQENEIPLQQQQTPSRVRRHRRAQYDPEEQVDFHHLSPDLP